MSETLPSETVPAETVPADIVTGEIVTAEIVTGDLVPSVLAPLPLPAACDVLAPDGSEVRILLRLAGGSMAHFTLPPGQASRAVVHRTVEEIWYVLGGPGEMWRRRGAEARVDALNAGDCLTIPVGTHFQFRATGGAPFCAVGITMPPWPGMDEAVPVEGVWPATAGAPLPA